MPEQRSSKATREDRANPNDPGQRFEPTPDNEYGPEGGLSLEATVERLRARSGGEAARARGNEMLEDDNPGADSADDVLEEIEREDRTFPRRTADGSQGHGAADDDQRMR